MTNNNFSNHTSFSCAGLHLDLALGVIKNAVGDTQRLSPINLKLLTHLLMHQGDVISRTELFDAVWPNQIVSDDVLTRAISDIRTQLTKLDADTKFIETLPKRGYRWIEPIHRLAIQMDIVAAPGLTESSLAAVIPRESTLKMAAFYLSLSLLLAIAFMWLISRTVTNQISLVVLPAVADGLQAELWAKRLDENLLVVLRRNREIKLVSKTAIASRPSNPFPYFYKEFDARWILESRISNNDIFTTVELSLVDAQTGIELRSLKFEAENNTELAAKLAKGLEQDLLISSPIH